MSLLNNVDLSQHQNNIITDGPEKLEIFIAVGRPIPCFPLPGSLDKGESSMLHSLRESANLGRDPVGLLPFFGQHPIQVMAVSFEMVSIFEIQTKQHRGQRTICLRGELRWSKLPRNCFPTNPVSPVGYYVCG